MDSMPLSPLTPLTPLSPSIINSQAGRITMSDAKTPDPEKDRTTSDELTSSGQDMTQSMTCTPFDICEDGEPLADIDGTLHTITASPGKQLLSECHNSQMQELVYASAVSQQMVVEHCLGTGSELDVDDIDDSCFSAFSEIPNMDMTKFAALSTPLAQSHRHSHSALSSATPTPRPHSAIPAEGDTTNLLLDFTQQFEAISSVTQRLRAVSRQSLSPIKADEPRLRSYLNAQRSPRKSTAPGLATPSSKNLLTLLDFELPPAPTPRSIPSITIREMESLKSAFASQISALKATLSGREAEVEALKRAISDAEGRVGEAVEQLREERSKRESAERQKDAWERRGTEFEDVLKRVKKEVLEGEQDKLELQKQADDANAHARELEIRLNDMEADVQRAQSRSANSDMSSTATDNIDTGTLFTAEQVQKQIDDKVHALSTELHAIYKRKHITKVAGLKKGFEAKTLEKTTDLLAKIENLEKRNDELQNKLDGTLSGVLPGLLVDKATGSVSSEVREAELKLMEEQKAIIERQKAEIVGREQELKAQRSEFDQVVSELERERVEKGELVAAVDEMLALQADVSIMHVTASTADITRPLSSAESGSTKNTSARPSGLARPGFGFAAQNRPQAAPSIGKPTAAKSKMMSNIERMAASRSAGI